jgi:hypothetical protein
VRRRALSWGPGPFWVDRGWRLPLGRTALGKAYARRDEPIEARRACAGPVGRRLAHRAADDGYAARGQGPRRARPGADRVGWHADGLTAREADVLDVLAGGREPRLLDHAARGRPADRRVRDDAHDRGVAPGEREQRAHGVRCMAAPPDRRYKRVADLDRVLLDEGAADLAHDDVVLDAVVEEWPEGPAGAGVLADARGELGRIPRRDGDLRQTTGGQRLGRAAADRLQDHGRSGWHGSGLPGPQALKQGLASLAMVFTSISVVTNALLLRRFRAGRGRWRAGGWSRPRSWRR